jgi:hypothetical protein
LVDKCKKIYTTSLEDTKVKVQNMLSLYSQQSRKLKSLTIPGPDAVAHAYNPNYLRGRDQEFCGSRSVQAKC